MKKILLIFCLIFTQNLYFADTTTNDSINQLIENFTIENNVDDEEFDNNISKEMVELISENLKKNSDVKEDIRKQITDFALTYLNTPYIWGSTGPKSFDCSGFVNYVYKEIATVQLPRTSYNIAKLKNKVEKDDLQIGDIIYFKTTKKKRISHVGIYIGDNKFVHASSAKKKVVISEIEGFYKRAYRGAVRPY